MNEYNVHTQTLQFNGKSKEPPHMSSISSLKQFKSDYIA